jgi:hypothetical protein
MVKTIVRAQQMPAVTESWGSEVQQGGGAWPRLHSFWCSVRTHHPCGLVHQNSSCLRTGSLSCTSESQCPEQHLSQSVPWQTLPGTSNASQDGLAEPNLPHSKQQPYNDPQTLDIRQGNVVTLKDRKKTRLAWDSPAHYLEGAPCHSTRRKRGEGKGAQGSSDPRTE